MIPPTVGRLVWYYPTGASPERDQPLAAIVAHVSSDTCVNLAIFDANGRPYATPPTSVLLVQEGAPIPTGGNYCTWMPYQLSKAKEALGKTYNPAGDRPK